MSAAYNPYEEAARLKKVQLMLAILPLPATRAEVDEQADALASASVEWRRAWSVVAGCATPPSEETWRWFVAAARERRTLTEALALVAARNDNGGAR